MTYLPSSFSILLNLFIFFSPIQVRASNQNNPSAFLSQEIWENVQDYLLPDDHPAKGILDEIFSQSRVLANLEEMRAANFINPAQQHHTQIVVARHLLLPGYIIKAYLDCSEYRHGNREHYYFIKRIKGARLTRKSITKNHFEHLLDVPDKWIYMLPDYPAPLEGSIAHRIFILIETEMNIFDQQENLNAWKSDKITKTHLKALHQVLFEAGLTDSSKPSNCPCTKEGRIALIDTQQSGKEVKFYRLTPFLTKKMKKHWLKLIHRKKYSIISLDELIYDE